MKKQLLFIFCIISIGLTAQLPSITNQPIITTVSVGANTTYSIIATGTITGYQWQVSSNGGISYNDISIAGSNPIYSGWTSNTLTVSGIPLIANGNMYRCIVFGSSTSNVETLTTPGSGSWTCPLGITSVTVQCWGAGGAGGSCPGGYMQNCSGGGGGGAFSSSTIVVSPGVSYPYTIGSGGTVTSTNGNSGGLTSFNNSTITASGGNGGGWRAPDGYNPGGAGGTGGITSNSVGTIKYNGGIGNSGTIGYCGGGGGGSAGTTGNGSNAPGGINWNGGSGSSQFGGNGGHGGSWADRGTYTGANGNSFGGGGGGSSNSNWSSNQTYGGNGADGAIKIGYNSPSSVISNSVILSVVSPPSITTTSSTNLINCGESATLTASSTSAAQPCLKADLPASLQNGLVGYWTFCGNANDASGNNNNGTVNGATLTSDRFGNANSAYNFDGNDEITIPYSAIFNSNQLSWNLWTKVDQFSSGVGYYIFGIRNNNEQSLCFHEQAGGYGTQMHWTSSAINAFSSSPSSTWRMLSITYNKQTYNYSFYVDGVLISTVVGGALGFTNGANPIVKIGIEANSNYWQSFQGKLDDISIYNRVLTASEVQQLYSLGNINYSWSPGSATSPTITVSPTQTTTYTCTASNSAGSSTSSITVNVADTLTWTGTVDTNWHKPCNWNPQFVPKCCNNVLVPFSSNQPVVSGIAAAEDVSINSTSGAVIKVNAGANLQVGVCPITITQSACPSLAVITTTAVSSITSTTAVSGGTITYQGATAVTARGICWSTSTNPTLANSFSTNGTGVGTFVANLTGLTAGTTYYVRAYATNASGTSYGNEVSFVSQALQVGQSFEGGVIAYIDNTGLHGFVVAPNDQSNGVYWHVSNIGVTGASGTSVGTGNNNTINITNMYGSENNAARICFDFVLGGFSDWFLPSKDELYHLYLNKLNIGGFSNSNYWSSSEEAVNASAWNIDFTNGNFNNNAPKFSNYKVRAIRYF